MLQLDREAIAWTATSKESLDSLEYSESVGSQRPSLTDLMEECIQGVKMINIRKVKALPAKAKQVECCQTRKEEMATLRFNFIRRPLAEMVPECQMLDQRITPKHLRKGSFRKVPREPTEPSQMRKKSISTDRCCKKRSKCIFKSDATKVNVSDGQVIRKAQPKEFTFGDKLPKLVRCDQRLWLPSLLEMQRPMRPLNSDRIFRSLRRRCL